MNVKARHGAIYFITFIDYYSWYRYVYLLSHRYEAFDMFKQQKWELNWNRELQVFELIEIVNFYQIYSKNIVKENVYTIV